MHPARFLTLTLALLLGVNGTPPLVAQWSVAATIGSARFWGGAKETADPQRSFVPYRPTFAGIGVEREVGRVGFGLRLRLAGASLALEGDDAVAAVKGMFDIYGFDPEVTFLVSRLESNLRVRVAAGPLVEFWTLADESTRTRIGGQLAIVLAIPITGRLETAVRAGGAVSASPFEDEDLPEGFERHALWRRELTGELHYRF